MKRTPLKRGSKKLRIFKRPIEDIEESLKLKTFLWNLWWELPIPERGCKSCGKKLHNPPRSYYFDHLIEKSKRPDLALERDNIFLCCLECHALKTDGHPTDPHREAIEKAKEKFGVS